jgi:hypothetical protein
MMMARRLVSAVAVLSTLGACGTRADAGPGARPAPGTMTTTGAPQGYAPSPPPGQPIAVPSPTQLPRIPVPQDGAWSLLERQQWATISHDFTRNFLDDLNNACGTRIEGNFVFESFRGRLTESQDHPLGAGASPLRDHAMAPFLAVREICSYGGDMEKNTVRAKVQRIEVRVVPTGNSSFVFANGVLAAMINPADGISEPTYKNFIMLEMKKRL